MNILMVLTSHDQLGNTGRKTGVWLEEFAAPYYVFKDAGARITLTSPKGGQPPLDPKSREAGTESAATKRFHQDREAQQAFADTVLLSSVSHEEFEGVFYPGGHGPLWDLSEDRDSIMLIESMHAADKPIGAVCHGPAAFRHAKRHDGRPLVEGKNVTGFTNTEEEAVQLASIVPFSVENSLKKCGGIYSRGPDWGSYVQVDGKLVTGQNPASSEEAARALLQLVLKEPESGDWDKRRT
ncbi:MAG TPA: type 1 glutamine amidotransferase domain-containing protein [Paucimonas sp.]|nr:type 1 glutamine amidotransferase domain-containing protein [Paucimonas sp.]